MLDSIEDRRAVQNLLTYRATLQGPLRESDRQRNCASACEIALNRSVIVFRKVLRAGGTAEVAYATALARGKSLVEIVQAWCPSLDFYKRLKDALSLEVDIVTAIKSNVENPVNHLGPSADSDVKSVKSAVPRTDTHKPYARRAEWFRQELIRREIASPNAFASYGGPSRESGNKILSGKAVGDLVLGRVVKGFNHQELTKKFPGIDRRDIPED